MKLKIFLFAAIALSGMGLATFQLLLKGQFQQTKAATFVASGADWIDDLARYDNRQTWLALRSSDFKLTLEETRGIADKKTILQTFKYNADPASSEVTALKTLFEDRFCNGILATKMRKNSVSKRLQFVNAESEMLSEITLSDKNCPALR